jgi:hypothetical protein
VTLDQQLRELTAETGDEIFTSVYLDVDGRRDPVWANVEARFGHLCRLARRQAEAMGGDPVRAVDDDLARIDEWLGSFDRSSVLGVAVFCDARSGVFRALPLHRKVEDEVAVGHSPRLVQLAGLVADDPRLLVAVVDRQRAAVYRWELGQLTERASVAREIPRAVDTNVEIGGFDRHRDDELLHHVHLAAAQVRAELNGWDALEVVVAGPEEAASALVNSLAGIDTPMTRITIESHASVDAVARAAEAIGAEVARGREAALLEQILVREPEGRAVMGIDETLAALADGKVDALLVARHWSSRGSRCVVCGRLDRPHTASCVRCGGQTAEIDDLVAAMTDAALAHGATVRLCDDESMVTIGGVGAITRF